MDTDMNRNSPTWIKDAVAFIQAARQHVVRQRNSVIVFTYYHIGKMIVEQEQMGKDRAAYGQEVLKQLSKELSLTFGSGFSERNLQQIRLFYLLYQSRFVPLNISQTVSAKFDTNYSFQSDSLADFAASFPLSWSHYVSLLSVKDEDEHYLPSKAELKGLVS